MIGYRDMTWCTFYKTCWKDKHCPRALTPVVERLALLWFKTFNSRATAEDVPYAQFIDKPQCYKQKKEKKMRTGQKYNIPNVTFKKLRQDEIPNAYLHSRKGSSKYEAMLAQALDLRAGQAFEIVGDNPLGAVNSMRNVIKQRDLQKELMLTVRNGRGFIIRT